MTTKQHLAELIAQFSKLSFPDLSRLPEVQDVKAEWVLEESRIVGLASQLASGSRIAPEDLNIEPKLLLLVEQLSEHRPEDLSDLKVYLNQLEALASVARSVARGCAGDV
jgi:hypothetical protein